jgi:hypothetical protein
LIFFVAVRDAGEAKEQQHVLSPVERVLVRVSRCLLADLLLLIDSGPRLSLVRGPETIAALTLARMKL